MAGGLAFRALLAGFSVVVVVVVPAAAAAAAAAAGKNTHTHTHTPRGGEFGPSHLARAFPPAGRATGRFLAFVGDARLLVL